jgi:hypothetical protein
MNPFQKTWDEETETYTLPAPILKYPASLPHDMACAMSPEEVELIRAKYELTEADLDYICNRQDFKREYAEWVQRLVTEGNSFKLKLRAMSEEFIPELHKMLYNENVAPSVKTDMFKYITKVAGLEPQPEKAIAEGQKGGGVTRFVVQWQDGAGQVAIETKND